MRKLAILALLLLLVATPSRALDTTELLGLVAMPLAVAAVADATGVSAAELSQVVSALNRADVPPTQFVQVIRYVPVAVVVEDDRPDFVQFVRDEVTQGVTGTRLVRTIDKRLRTYDIVPEIITLTEPATTFVVSENFVPPVVITRVAEVRTAPLQTVDLNTTELLALIAMPLAVSAVADIAGISLEDLSSFVALLNAGNVPPVRVVEMLRFVPVALVTDSDPRFVQVVRTEVDRGLTGEALVNVITQRLREFDVLPQIDVRGPARVIVVDENFVPPAVVRRVTEVRAHPHGGPPGQLKKERGVQTGAEIVHGTQPGRRGRGARVETPPVVRVVPPPNVGRGGPEVKPPKGAKPEKAKGQGKGKGKGKGKD